MIIDIITRSNNLEISYIDENGLVDIMKKTIPDSEMFLYVESEKQCTNTNKISWTGKPVKTIKTDNLSKYRILEYIEKHFTKEEKDLLFSYNTPRKYFVDIETEVTDDGFPDPKIAKNKITAIAVCTGSNIICMGSKPLSALEIKSIEEDTNKYLSDFGEKITVKYKYFEEEQKMLEDFFYKILPKAPLVTGWNFINFDWTYLKNRAKIYDIDISLCSPSKSVKRDGDPYHKAFVDYLEIYRKWDRVIEVKENNSLDFVAKAALGVSKIKYNGSLQDLYNKDYQTYILYNVIDTKLVELIDKRLKTISVMFTLANVSKVELLKTYSPISMTESVLCYMLLDENKVIPFNRDRKEREAYEGAYVFEPTPGMYRGIIALDFASLYPSIMRQWNISPETYIKNIPKEEFKNVDLSQYTLTASGAIYYNEKTQKGIFNTMLSSYYKKRKESKSKMEEIDLEIEKLKALKKKL